MATKRFKELKSLSKDELATKLRELEQNFFEAKMKHVTGQLGDTATLWKTRKDIARVKMLAASAGKSTAAAK
jgi:ribosomal protein L29